jgi:hypothetical protein
MSQATLVDTSSTVPPSGRRPGPSGRCAAISTTATTKADEIGFESLMPSEMPLTIANTNTSSTREREIADRLAEHEVAVAIDRTPQHAPTAAAGRVDALPIGSARRRLHRAAAR